MNIFINKHLPIVVCLFFLTFPLLIFAETSPLYTLSGIPGLEEAQSNSNDFSNFINAIYRMSIGVGAALAVLVIIFSGIQYSMSAVGGKKAELRGRITMALGGLGLLLGAFVFLEFINPGLTNLDPEKLDEVKLSQDEFDPVDKDNAPLDPNRAGPR